MRCHDHDAGLSERIRQHRASLADKACVADADDFVDQHDLVR